MIVDIGLNHNLDVLFHNATQVHPWYMGLIQSDNWSAIAAGDAMDSHAGWEECTVYAGDRKEYEEAAALNQVTTNEASKAEFAISGSKTVKGCFLNSAATGTAGTLLDAILFTGGNQAVEDGDTLQVTLTFTASDQ